LLPIKPRQQGLSVSLKNKPVVLEPNPLALPDKSKGPEPLDEAESREDEDDVGAKSGNDIATVRPEKPMLRACDFCVEIFLTGDEATLIASPSNKGLLAD
jgi:hypothetical protein